MLNKDEIKKVILQREPFLMIDEITDYIPGKYAIGYKNINKNEKFFKGHFPNNPIMPGVLIIEALAQTGCVSILSMDEYKGKNVLLCGINKMRFKNMAIPGDKLKLEVKLINIQNSIGIGEGIATIDGKTIAKGEMIFGVV